MDVSYQNASDIATRYVIILFMTLAQMYNFKIDMTFIDSWGIVREDGKHDGMAGEIERGRSEFGLSTFTMNTTRFDAVDFSFPVWKYRPIFIFLNPKTFGTYEALLLPFPSNVWLCVLFITVFIIILLKLVKKFYLNYLGTGDINDNTWSGNSVIIIGVISFQGFLNCSNRLPERIILYSTLIFGMLVGIFYNAMLVSSLLQPLPSSIQNCQQLIESNMKIGIENLTYYRVYFQTTKHNLAKEVYLKKIKTGDGGFYSLQEGINLVRNSEFAYYSEEPDLYHIMSESFTNNDICRLVEIELITPVDDTCPIKKHSQLKELINLGFMSLKENGVMAKEIRQWRKLLPLCQKNKDVQTIKLQTLIIPYTILICGINLSLVILIIEILICKKCNKIKVSDRKTKNNN
ncbi:ionotropic receptor 75a-like [Lycorma delicatula]|uniref:ionotropic receptor 75a-like n=1 Tax=Lycorma delicatula TaxID=130591 RepID=UPI003F511B62